MHDRANFLQNLPAKSLFPSLITLGTTSGPAPPLTIVAD
jgi:hypothetical protein